MQTLPKEARDIIAAKLPKGFTAKVGIVLGSGLGPLADEVEVIARFFYSDLPGFFVSTVVGHAGELIIGHLKGVPVVCMKGRVHLYEGASFEAMRLPIYVMKLLGCEYLLMTNASGSLRQDIGPGSVVLVRDQLNLTGRNALVGPNWDEFGPRFVAMEDAYDPELGDRFKTAASALEIEMTEGVYVGVLGPAYETPAEIQAFAKLGGHLVGMSTVNEVIIARHCGLKVAVVSAITNFAAGLSTQKVSHEEVLENANLAMQKLVALFLAVIPSLK